jgi:hypothetical protein
LAAFVPEDIRIRILGFAVSCSSESSLESLSSFPPFLGPTLPKDSTSATLVLVQTRLAHLLFDMHLLHFLHALRLHPSHSPQATTFPVGFLAGFLGVFTFFTLSASSSYTSMTLPLNVKVNEEEY